MCELQPDGLMLRDHLEKAANANFLPNPEAIAQLDAQPEMPTEAAAVILWADFLTLHNRRTWTEAGPQRLTLEAIHAWQTVRRVTLEPWEFDAILALDDEFFASRAEGKK